VEEVIRVVTPNTWREQVNAPRQAAIECGRRDSTDSSSLPDGEGTAVTTDVSDLRPENQPAPVLRRSGRHGHLAQAPRAMLEPGASNEAECDPLSYGEALELSSCADLKDSMDAEFCSLVVNKTWTYCSTIPVGAHPIGCKWVYVLQTNPDRSQRFKA